MLDHNCYAKSNSSIFGQCLPRTELLSRIPDLSIKKINFFPPKDKRDVSDVVMCQGWWA